MLVLNLQAEDEMPENIAVHACKLARTLNVIVVVKLADDGGEIYAKPSDDPVSVLKDYERERKLANYPQGWCQKNQSSP